MWQVFWLVNVAAASTMELMIPKGDELLSIDRWVLNYVSFNMTSLVYIQFGVVLGVWGFSGIWEAIQEAG